MVHEVSDRLSQALHVFLDRSDVQRLTLDIDWDRRRVSANARIPSHEDRHRFIDATTRLNTTADEAVEQVLDRLASGVAKYQKEGQYANT